VTKTPARQGIKNGGINSRSCRFLMFILFLRHSLTAVPVAMEAQAKAIAAVVPV